jgi:methyl-accepting chemotaxis protein
MTTVKSTPFFTKLKFKIPLGVNLCSLITGVAIGLISYFNATEALHKGSQNNLQAVLSSRRNHIVQYLDSLKEDILVLSSSREVATALQQFQGAWDEIEGNRTQVLQDGYIHKNPNPAGQKEKLDFSDDGSSYSYVHQQRHPWFRKTLQTKGLYDIFLIDLKGNVIYTVFKELDFASNLLSSEVKDGGLSQVYRKALLEPEHKAVFQDFEPYAPSNNVPAAFIAQAILDDQGNKIGVLAFQMPIERLNRVFADYSGLGEQGEAFIVGENKLMRSDSRFLNGESTTILKRVIDTAPVEEALSGKTGTILTKNYADMATLSSYSALEFLGTKWAIIAEIPKAEAYAASVALWNSQWQWNIVLNLIIMVLGTAIAMRFCSVLTKLARAMNDIANNDLSVSVPGLGRSDEVGEMALALGQFKENAVQIKQLTEEQARQEEAAAREKMEQERIRREEVLSLAAEFEDQVQGIASMIAATSTELCATAENMKRVVAEMSGITTTVSASSSRTAESVKGVAQSINQMSTNVQQILGQINRSMEVVNGAVTSAESADKTVSSLSHAVSQIGDISEVIEGITGRINLLALNATIESARAGEVGRGFGVVASQVKNLAGQTAQATTQIIDNISNVRDVSEEVAVVLHGIQHSITDVNRYSSQIAGSIEEQSRTANRIAENMVQTSTNVSQINHGIMEVARGVNDADTSASEVLSVAEILSEQSEKLNQQMTLFLQNIRRNSDR